MKSLLGNSSGVIVNDDKSILSFILLEISERKVTTNRLTSKGFEKLCATAYCTNGGYSLFLRHKTLYDMNLIPAQALITNPVQIFFIVLVIILLSPLVFKRLKIPHIVGLIAAGVIVGPFGFNILERDSSFEIFGQVGLLYLMFLVGLEIDMFNLKRNMRKGLIFGLYTLIVPIVLGMVASVYLLDVGWATSILLASMYASHTLIAYPVVSRYEITKNPAAIIAIVGTIIAVFGALIALAIGVGLNESGLDSFYFARLGVLLIVYIIGVVYLFPRITRWFFKRYTDGVTQFLFVISMAFLASFLAQVIGLEPVLGAFFAGLVLNRYVPSASPLMGRIEFVGNALFIPYFLIGVGMLINVRVLSNPSTLWVTFNMIAVALVAKWLAAWAAQKTYKMDGAQRNLMFGLSTAHTAVALAVVMIGYRMTRADGSPLLDESILNGTILMILVTCVISSIVTERAASQIKLNSDIEEVNDKYLNAELSDKMLITVSNPITTAGLVDLAILMSSKSAEESLYALHVRNEESQGAVQMAQNALNIASKAAAAADREITQIERYDLNIVTGILNTMKERNISDVILGLHQRATALDSFFGNKLEQMLINTNKMISIARCFIPLNTITRIIVCVPDKAQFETGFREWVVRVGNLAKQIGCKVIFCCVKYTRAPILSVLHQAGIEIRTEFRILDTWSDYVMIATKILDDDLLIMIGARRTSISFDSEMDNMPGILSKYFNHNNLLIIFPEQFGKEENITTSFIDPTLSDINVSPSGLLLRIRGWYKWLVLQKKRITHRNNRKRNSDFDL